MTQTNLQLQQGDALVLVDVQNDFCPGGKLAIQDGDQVVPVLNHWIHQALSNDVPVYASRDWHPIGHPSFAPAGPWSEHCLQDTQGAQFHPDLNLPENTIIVTKGVRFDKDQNSAFDETGLAEHLKQAHIKRLVIGGLALDVCVLATVLDGLKHGFKIVVIEAGTRPVSEADGQNAWDRMRDAGAKAITGDAAPALEVCTLAPEWAEHARPNEAGDACDDGRGKREV